MKRPFPPLQMLATDSARFGQRIGLLCNHSAWLRSEGRYLFQALAAQKTLRRVFIPEHGLFAELQDQAPLAEGGIYQRLAPGVDFVSLYGETEDSLVAAGPVLADLDCIVVDLQDVGARYYTFATTLSYLFDALHAAELRPRLVIVDRPNPAGRSIEGSLLPTEYASFVGRPGLPHRHGLSLGELARFYRAQIGVELPLEFLAAKDPPWEISPSPNMPSPITPLVYSGQCLLEGTNLSEGRGTTRPFEIFGAPYLDFVFDRPPPPHAGARLRALQFLPTFHKWANELCSGFQIHLDGNPYHSLAHTLKLLRWIQNESPGFQWRHGVYEFRSDRPAIELLAGDPLLLDYLYGRARFAEVRQWLREQESAWRDQASAFLLDNKALRCVDLSAAQDID